MNLLRFAERDLSVLQSMLGIEIKGVASHGGQTGLNMLGLLAYKRCK